MHLIESILELARWAPSGDNTQPWRFEIIDARHVAVHCHDTRDHCVYDLDGHASQLAMGCLLETMDIAASSVGLLMRVEHRSDSPETHPVFDARFIEDASVSTDPLFPFITKRCVQRRPMRARPLDDREIAALEQAVSPDHSIFWQHSLDEKWRCARLMFANAKIRLTTPEAYRVHREIIEWNSRHSLTKVPDQAVGVDRMTLKLMRWAMQSWQRVDFLNRYLMGTLMPRLQLDLIPGIACAAHLGIVTRRPPANLADYVAAGRAMQRLWLTATSLDLQIQPEMTPVIFSRYVREGREFTASPAPRALAHQLAERYAALLGDSTTDRLVFLGRVGAGPVATARSLRLPLNELMKTSSR